MDKKFITTSFTFEGYTIKEYMGVVRGITVRSRSIVGNLVAFIESIFGGNISIYTELCEQARQEAFDIMIRHASEMQANAICVTTQMKSLKVLQKYYVMVRP